MAKSQAPSITEVSHPLATIWLAHERNPEANYFYGGTRLINPSSSDASVKSALLRLMSDESGTKNRLIDWSLKSGSFAELQAELPPGFLESRVGGARCLIRPRTREIEASLTDPQNPHNRIAVASILERIGEVLNEQKGLIKLTPDFGRYADLADVLYQYTPNVLGIACSKGGCGGKSSYATTGVVAAMEKVAAKRLDHEPVTCIGSAGAMGSGIVQYLLGRGIRNVAVCDLAYDEPDGTQPPTEYMHLKSVPGSFSGECLSRGGVIVSTTVGDELEGSPWQQIPKGTMLFLAHNLALPRGESGIQLAKALDDQGVLAIPGQVLTLGGALTARLEWHWRRLPVNPAFKKDLAHRVVRCVVRHILGAMFDVVESSATTPYQAMFHLVNEDQRLNVL